jgi:hypothetical protein
VRFGDPADRGAPEQAGTVNAIPYGYERDSGADVMSIVTAGAGHREDPRTANLTRVSARRGG